MNMNDPNFLAQMEQMMGGQGGGFDFGGLGGGNQDDGKDPEEKYKDQLEQLEGMGFTNK